MSIFALYLCLHGWNKEFGYEYVDYELLIWYACYAIHLNKFTGVGEKYFQMKYVLFGPKNIPHWNELRSKVYS